MLCHPLPECGNNLWLASSPQNVARVNRISLLWLLYKLITSVFPAVALDSLPCWFWWSKPPCEEACVARNSEHPAAASQLGAKALILMTYKEPNPDQNHMSLEADPSPVEPRDKTISWLSPCKRPWSRRLAKHACFPTHTNCVVLRH